MKTSIRSLAIIVPVALLCAAVAPAAAAATPDGYGYDQPGDKDHVSNTAILERFSPNGGNNQSYKVVADRAEATASFTATPITVDGVAEATWDGATSYPIDNKFTANMSGANPAATTTGALKLMWDGPVLYGLVQVSGDATQSDSGTPNWTSASYTPNTDGLFVSMDVFNDQWGLETDTQGIFFGGANPALTDVTSFNNFGIPSLGSFFNPNNQDYSTRLKDFKSSGYTAGSGVNYTYEFALQIEGWGDQPDRALENGTKIGLEIGIFDQAQSFTYWSKTQNFAGQEGGSNLPNSERVRNRDWGVVTLGGWDGQTPLAYSGWSADEDIRFWNSKSNPGGSGNGTLPSNSGDGSAVWTPESKEDFVTAKNAYLAIKDSQTATRAEKEAAVTAVTDAFTALRWADTTYPDPRDLPKLQTLPSAFTFFDPSKGTNGQVTNAAQWADRKKELLDLAQFYEYGYKPRLGVDYTINITGNTYAGTGNPTVTAQVVPTNANFAGGVPVNISIPITLPTSVPGGGKAAVGFSTNFTANGIANVNFPTWGSDNRTDTGAWGNPNRTGTFYTLFPYVRNSTSADSSILIANATAVSVFLDALQAAVSQNPALAAKIDPSRAVTKGFSINGKNAFVAAVFDDRVKAVIAGGAGATGPANWRYNAQGQEFDFSGTAYYNPGAEKIVAHGTEGPGNSYRHNRVRETELFRHFMPYGHMYDHEDGSYAYGGYSRLPFDQSLLVATLAPERAIIIDTNLNDYNDGAVTDNMSLQIAKSVYDNLGVNGSDFVKFNSGNYVSAGDPHGAANGAIEGKYVSDLLYGTTTLTTDEANRLNTDPYSLQVSNGKTQSPYDYYWGGYNTITGGSTGVAGADGWYFTGFDSELAALRAQVDGLSVDANTNTSLNAKLDQVVLLLEQGKRTEAAATLGTSFIADVAALQTAGSISAGQATALTTTASQLVLAINEDEELTPAPLLNVAVSADPRALAGKVYLSVAATNNGPVPVDVVITTAYGNKTFAGVAPGKTVSVSVNSKLTSVPAGAATAKVTGAPHGVAVTEEKSAPYAAFSTP